ncbi:MAG: hypothetical protein KAJ03_01710 [Gammaproteobacteria bacterium]|nr:hypothetical protein [Gammaproteobacteria bacterium]
MTIHCDMNCSRACPAYDGNAHDGCCKLVNAEVAKLDAERRYYDSMTKTTVQVVQPALVTFNGSTVNGLPFDPCAQGCDACGNTACVDLDRHAEHMKIKHANDYPSKDVEGY